MSGAFEPRVDSREIDWRQRRELAAAREGESPELFAALEVAAAEDRTRLGQLLALSPSQYKSFENRLRRMADRQGLQLVKSRRRDRKFADHGKYMLVDAATHDVATGGNWSLDLADVEKILLGTAPSARRLNARDCPMCGIATYSLSGLVQGALVKERECPDCGHSFVAEPQTAHRTRSPRTAGQLVPPVLPPPVPPEAHIHDPRAESPLFAELQAAPAHVGDGPRADADDGGRQVLGDLVDRLGS